MRFPPSFLDEIRARLPVSEVVGRRVKLRKQGREFAGLSPFNAEKTPSFFVNDHKGFYHDFSSGKHGDVFRFLMETEGVSFPEAVERCADMVGLPMPKVSEESIEREERRKSLHEVMEAAAKFFEVQLQARAGAKARGYLADRALGGDLQLKFRLGYAPAERFALKEHLGAQGIPVEDMIETGLLIHGAEIPVPYDRFRDRIMFPITDMRGRIVAFGGRAMEKDVPAKYLNSPETTLFHKGATLYNGAKARAAAHKGAKVMVVEGYVDVIALVSTGFEAAVAPLGTALTEDQLKLVWSMNEEPVLCFDGDKAGRRAAYRAAGIALPFIAPGKSLAFASLPEGQDPDDLIRAGGREAMEQVLAGARPLVDVIWMRETEMGGFDTPERRAALEARINEITATITDENVRRHYREELNRRLGALFGRGQPQNRGAQRPGTRPRQPMGGAQRGRGGNFRPYDAGPLAPVSPRLLASPLLRSSRADLPAREALILSAVLNHPWLVGLHAEEFAALEFKSADADHLRGILLDIVGEHDLAPADLLQRLEESGHGEPVARVRAALTHSADWPALEAAARPDVEQWWTHVVGLHHKRLTLHKELKDAERALGADPSEANFGWLKDVQSRLAAVEGTEALIEGFGSASGRGGKAF